VSKISLTEAPECTIYRPCFQNFKRAEYGLSKYIYVWWMKKYTATIDTLGGLPISRVAPLDQLLPLSLGSSGWFSQCMFYEDSKDFLSNNCSIRTRNLHFNTIFPKPTVMQQVNIWFCFHCHFIDDILNFRMCPNFGWSLTWSILARFKPF